jgi:hypothetical protein
MESAGVGQWQDSVQEAQAPEPEPEQLVAPSRSATILAFW